MEEGTGEEFWKWVVGRDDDEAFSVRSPLW